MWYFQTFILEASQKHFFLISSVCGSIVVLEPANEQNDAMQVRCTRREILEILTEEIPVPSNAVVFLEQCGAREVCCA